MNPKLLVFVAVVLLVPSVFASDTYEPYLHKAEVPEHPEVKVYGRYATNMYPGAATYTYEIEVPKGTNGLQPSVSITYNSQSVKQRPSILGAGWMLNVKDYIYRDVNGTVSDTTDDEFILILGGTPYKLRSHQGEWHTEVESHFKILELTGAPNTHGTYWTLQKKDGTEYRFGYNSDAELASNLGFSHSVVWSIDKIEDTHSNAIFYSYLEDPNPEDSGTVYLDNITYNSDRSRVVKFVYESAERPDDRLVVQNGVLLDESRRLADIYVFANSDLVRRHHLDYTSLYSSLSSLSNVIHIGSDNQSVLYNISMDYYSTEPGYVNNSGWDPPVLFSNESGADFGVRMVDANNDGFLDIFKAKSATREQWLNDRESNWTEADWEMPVEFVGATGIDRGTRFADVNGDGFTDVIHADHDTYDIYLNNGSDWILSNEWTFPVSFIDSYGIDQGVRLAEVNGDSKVDVIHANAGNKAVYLNNGSGWSLTGLTFPVRIITSGNDDNGTRVVDVNGDGLVDVLQGLAGFRRAWINNGTDWNMQSNWNPPADFTTAAGKDNGVRFMDVNADGLPDVIHDYDVGATNVRKAYLNTGAGWETDDEWVSPESFNKDSKNAGKRIADVNGDGFADILVTHEDSSSQYTWIKNSSPPYLLKEIRTEYGGIVKINYTESTKFNNSENGTSDIGFNIYVVSDISRNTSVNSTLGQVSFTSYNYSWGKYDYAESEFRGFKKSTEHSGAKVINHYFHQDDVRKGKEFRTEVYDDAENIFSKEEKDFSWTSANGIHNLSLKSSTKYVYDGEAANPLVTNKSFLYDTYNNLLSVVDYGDVSVQGDEKYTNYSYAINTEYWILDKVANIEVYDENFNRIRETRYYYDSLGLNGQGSKGELTKEERWNNNGNNSYTYYEYDSYGNVVAETDPLGNIITYSYDDANTYPDSIKNAAGHISYFEYDVGTGNLNWRETNDVRTSYEYDVFGRISQEILPYDTNTSPTKSYTYSFDGIAPESVKVTLKNTGNKTNDIHYFYDGFGSLIQLKSDVEDNQQIVKNVFYDEYNRVDKEQNPYLEDYSEGLSNVSGSAAYTLYTYDAVDRVIRIDYPDGSFRNITFDHKEVIDYDQNGNSHKYVLDGLGRIVEVHEYNTNDVGEPEEYVTSYSYDQNDNLILITDALGNRFEFAYDSLGRKISMDDPDMGVWSYAYDAAGNLVLQTDARGESIALAYDGLNRIQSKQSDDQTLHFVYDVDYYGTLTNITTENRSFAYTYDDRLRVVEETQFVEELELPTEFIYDAQNRMISEVSSFSDVDYIYNKRGKVGKIPGIINNSAYDAFGSVLNKTYANGLIAKYTYNPNTNRLTSIIIPEVQNLSYTYDSVGNILSINDGISGNNHELSYDNLDRLVEATIGPDRYVYSFNAIGNIMKIVQNNESKKFVYEGNQVHAPSTIIQGSSGADVYSPKDIGNGSKNRTIEFFLVNDNEESILLNASIDFGDGNTFSNDTLNVSDSIMFLIENEYSSGGDYVLNVSTASSGIEDMQVVPLKFGVRADSLSLSLVNGTNYTFELVGHNDVSEEVYNVSWNCSDGIYSVNSSNLTAYQQIVGTFSQEYATPGERVLNCTVSSLDGSEAVSLTFEVRGIEVENYDVLVTNISTRVVSYDVYNYFDDQEVNISMESDGFFSSEKTNISQNEGVMVFVEVDYDSDGTKSFEVDMVAENYSNNYVETFTTDGVSILNYDREMVNNTINVISFEVRNNWHDGRVNWSLNDPEIANVSDLDHNESLMVIVENNETDQGNSRAEVAAVASYFVDNVKNAFEVSPLKIRSLTTLSEGSSAVSEVVVVNNAGALQWFDWIFDTGAGTLYSTSTLNVSDHVFLLIESNYSQEGVYKTSAFVNSSAYNDSEAGVVVT